MNTKSTLGPAGHPNRDALWLPLLGVIAAPAIEALPHARGWVERRS